MLPPFTWPKSIPPRSDQEASACQRSPPPSLHGLGPNPQRAHPRPSGSTDVQPGGPDGTAAPALPLTLHNTGFSQSVLAVGRGGQAGPAMSPASEGWLESEGDSTAPSAQRHSGRSSLRPHTQAGLPEGGGGASLAMAGRLVDTLHRQALPPVPSLPELCAPEQSPQPLWARFPHSSLQIPFLSVS